MQFGQERLLRMLSRVARHQEAEEAEDDWSHGDYMVQHQMPPFLDPAISTLTAPHPTAATAP